MNFVFKLDKFSQFLAIGEGIVSYCQGRLSHEGVIVRSNLLQNNNNKVVIVFMVET